MGVSDDVCIWGEGHGVSGCDFMEVILPCNFISIKEIPDFYLFTGYLHDISFEIFLHP